MAPRATSLKRLASLIGLLTLALACALNAQIRAQPRVQTRVHVQGGTLEGAAMGDVLAFKGIPFAAPPVGDGRWRPPQPAQPWAGIRPALTYAPGCMQVVVRTQPPWTEEFMPQGDRSEDCLYLNVWTPRTPPRISGPIPVYLFIHGGAFLQGSTSVAVYDGAALAAQGVVVVTIQYRLGVYGFLAHPDLTSESPQHASGNYGLLDCLAALRWVKENIGAFGGDPGKITMGGQSAGAAAVHDLLASPLARGLVAGAIAESGSSVGPSMQLLANAEQQGRAFAAARGVSSLAALRALPAEKLLPIPSDPKTFRFAPVVDGWSLPEDPMTAVVAGHALDVPILTGMQADEGSSSPTYGHSSVAQLQEASARTYGAEAGRFSTLYPFSTDTEAASMSKVAARDRGLASMYLWASLTAAHNRSPLFTYYWAHALPWPERPEFASFHSSEVPYVLGNIRVMHRPFTAEDELISNTTMQLWANFIRTGNPNSGGLQTWPRFDAARAQTLEIDAKIHVRPLMSAERLAFWKTVLAPSLPDAQKKKGAE